MTYTDVQCPRCGYPEAVDHGPYTDYAPGIDDKLPPLDPDVHYLTCGRCGKGFDAAPEAAHERRRAWTESRHEQGNHHCCDPAACAWAAMGIWDSQ